MTANSDNVLTDLLSDNSNENDSFFENSLLPIKRTSKSVISSAGSKSIKSGDNLFGRSLITEEKKMYYSRAVSSSTPIASNNDDIIVTDEEDLGFDPKKPKASAGKLALFDDILTVGQSESKRLTPIPAIRPSSNRDDRRPGPGISRQSTDSTTENSNAQRPKTSSGRRGANFSNAMNLDPLGIFSQPSTKDKIQQHTKKSANTAGWLELNTIDTDEDRALSTSERRIESPKSSHLDDRVQKDRIPKREFDVLKVTSENLDPPDERSEHKNDVATDYVVGTNAAQTAQSIFQLNAANLETQNAFAMLKQQEPQLLFAAQMKQQERALLEMQRRQETLLQKQERQFETLLQQQMQRQQHLEENIKLQQQRINAHIQLMLTQPAIALDALPVDRTVNLGIAASSADEHPPPTPGRDLSSDSGPQAALDLIQIETDMRRLELEKQRLEELVANLQAKYEREIEMIETTHKKQLDVLDEHTVSLESRLRGEITEITDYYKGKLSVLEQDNQQKIRNYEEQLSSVRQDHEDELRRVRAANEENILRLREEQKQVLESIQRSKLLEFALVQDNSSYLDTIKAASANLTVATSGLHDLRDDLCSKLELANKEKQQELELRERRLEDKERKLQLSEATAEQEKARLMKLVSSLEGQLCLLNKETNEENWELRLKLSALEADKAAFEREREYVRQQIQHDEIRLRDLKEHQIAEIQRMSLELQQERRQLQMDKIKFETEQKLRLGSNNKNREQCEIDAAIQCAQDATRQADAERQRYITEQRDLEQRKRKLVNTESELRVKEERLNAELKACLAAKQHAQETSHKARLIEQNYQEKIQIIQSRMRELAEKEAFLAEERKLLAQQRIAIKETQSRTTDAKQNVPELKRPIAQKSLNLVDRLLDDHISESMQRLNLRTPASKPIATWPNEIDQPYIDAWSVPMGLDDDSKSLVLNSNFEALEHSLRGKNVSTEL